MTNPNQVRTDGDLLAEFVVSGSQTAFAEVVQRHASMVHGVCWRVLSDPHEAQDVAQAAFVALARKASSLRHEPSIGGWLHRVAWCIAQNTRIARSRRQQREVRAMEQTPLTDLPPGDAAAVRDELDRVVNQLPDRYRLPLVLFHLESKSLEQTARALGLNIKTASTRLVRARELLRRKLVRRGIGVGSVGALTVLLSAESGAAVLPATFVASTVKAATGGAVSTTVAALSQGAIHAMFIAKVKTVSLTAAACIIVAGTGIVAAKQLAAPPTAPQSTAAPAAVAPSALPASERVIAEAPPSRPQTPAGPVAAKTATVLPLAESASVRLDNGLELIAFGPSQADAPTRTRATPLTLGVRVTNPTAQPQEFWPAKTQLMLRWGNGEWQAVGENSNRSALPHPVTVPAGATQTYTLADAKLAYIGKPLYLAFWSVAFRPGAMYEKELKGVADQIAFAFEYEQDQPSPRTGEIVCRLVAAPEVAAPAVNEYVAQQTAQLWVTAFLQGRNDQLAALAETPFCLFNEPVGTAEELATRLAKAQQDAKRWSEWFAAGKLRLEKVTLLKNEAAAFTADRSFKKLANLSNVALLRVRLVIELENERGGVDFGVAIQPANNRVVGFGED